MRHNLLFFAHALCMNYVSIGYTVPKNRVNNYSVLCTVKAKKEKKNTQQTILSSFITRVKAGALFACKRCVGYPAIGT